MPELPEVELIRRQLTDEVLGRVFTEAVFDPENGNSLKLRQKKDLEAILPGKKILKAGRRGKHLFLSLTDDYHLMFHLKMTGRLLLRGLNGQIDEFLRLTLKLDDERELRFTDRARFADVFLWDNEDLVALDNKLGPEPDDAITDYLQQALSSTKLSNIKEALLDQSILAGVGNINADEALFVAKIHPKREPATVSKEDAEILLSSIKQVLEKDLANGGSTIDSYLNLYGEPGKNQESFYVYGRAGEPCRDCSTPIELIEISSRRTHFCPSCQKKDSLTLF
ncbi:MAG: DNA-formamidopyrimidine glycosylase [Candidatus Woykebacteria bacterium RIFCSPHIGHO2_12_FULL_45_10]|uniref:DNA-formamidopyrimidine glycosylase n=1 Tax=Candidatus Woykebacteria bacterium RIFCSPHIGHO2_12_FULL_45_10 TaxID=1802603 RepID=A0A1G1WRG4_9BACT|nr:MAG: DNA-formamidopyrimidine glycosylase [Candidatus Woykebacteria bacterium RIFCSPHIGHO2_12_FULL_45_10]